LLFNVEEFVLKGDQIITEQYQTKMWNSSLTPNKLGVVTVKPESLSLRGLIDYLDYLEANEQDPSRYQLAFWRKIMQPLTVAVMLLVALSFIFGPLRSVSMGARIMMGVFTGILFFLSNEVLGSLSLVYQLSPMFGAFMPSAIFIAVAWYLMAKKRV
jgi:lipopolysaccharide export system permease protein